VADLHDDNVSLDETPTGTAGLIGSVMRYCGGASVQPMRFTHMVESCSLCLCLSGRLTTYDTNYALTACGTWRHQLGRDSIESRRV